MFTFPEPIERALSLMKIDLNTARMRVSLPLAAVATLCAVTGSLLADGLLVGIGTHIFPSTAGYVHFQFSDFAKLTILGVLFACGGWPVVSFFSPTPRWLYARLAVLGTLVLYLPDLDIMATGQPLKAVAILMVMHLAVILVTYFAMTRIAPAADQEKSVAMAHRAHPSMTASGAMKGRS